MLTLYPDQITFRDAVHARWRGGVRKLVAVAPTGFGKRIMAVWWSKQAIAQGRRVLFVGDRQVVVDQKADEAIKRDVEHGVIMGDRPSNREAPLQVASIQTLSARYLDTGIGMPPGDLVIIDECHKDLERYKRLLDYYKDALVLGLTATPVDANGLLLAPGMYQEVVEPIKNSELIRNGRLLATHVFAPWEVDVDGEGGDAVKRSGKEYVQKALGERIESLDCYGDAFKEYSMHADRKAIAWLPDVKSANGFAEQFGNRFGADRVAVVTGQTKRKDRQRIYGAFNDGEIQVLVSVDVLREAFDAPIASLGLDLQPTRSLRTAWQKWGRIKRSYRDQQDAVLIDMAGNTTRLLVHPDDDPDWFGDGSVEERRQFDVREGKKPKPWKCPRCGFQPPKGYVPKCPICGHETADEKVVRWVRMGNGKLKKVTKLDLGKVKKTKEDRVEQAWKSCLYIAHGAKSNLTLAQLKHLYRERFEAKGYPPLPPNLPCMPAPGSAEWKRSAKAVYPKSMIEKLFKRAQQFSEEEAPF